jgi:hypothetical protein
MNTKTYLWHRFFQQHGGSELRWRIGASTEMSHGKRDEGK